MNAVDLKELKEAAEKATPGPWECITDTQWGDRSSTQVIEVWTERNQILIGTEVRRAHRDGGVENMRYIALANPSTILSLIARVEQMEEALREFADCAVVRAGDYDVSVSGWNTTELNSAWQSARRALETPANPIEEVVE